MCVPKDMCAPVYLGSNLINDTFYYKSQDKDTVKKLFLSYIQLCFILHKYWNLGKYTILRSHYLLKAYPTLAQYFNIKDIVFFMR